MRRCFIKLLFLLGFSLGLGLGAVAADKPYDESADADQSLSEAFSRARAEHKQVMVVFGANWCPDCRILDTILHSAEAGALSQRFVLVKINVGGFDRNLSVAHHFDVPLEKGIPAVVFADADESVRFVTRAGELAEAKSLGSDAVLHFLTAAADRSRPPQ